MQLRIRKVSLSLVTAFFSVLIFGSATACEFGSAEQARLAIFNSESGKSNAVKLVGQLRYCLLVPGFPPEWVYEISHREYGKYGIAYEFTGDSSDAEYEKYRQAFNGVMVKAIEEKYGNGFLESQGRSVQESLNKEAKRRNIRNYE